MGLSKPLEMTKSIFFLGVLFMNFLIGCNQQKANPEKKSINHSSNPSDIQEAKDHDKLNEILNLISLHEYQERENGRGIFTPSELQHLKDSINYDSLLAIKFTKLPVIKLSD